MDRDRKLEVFGKIFYPSFNQSYAQKLIRLYITPQSNVLEIGAGSGSGKQFWHDLKKNCSKLVGIDLDPRVLENENLHEAYVIDACELSEKLPESEFDLVFSVMVAEHIRDARTFLAEQLALLTQGGKCVHITVSKYYWTSLLNELVPTSVKHWLVRHLGSGRESHDVFPAYYMLNSASEVKALSRALGRDVEIMRVDIPPGYLSRSFVLMFLYYLIHKPLSFFFPPLKPIFIFVVK